MTEQPDLFSAWANHAVAGKNARSREAAKKVFLKTGSQRKRVFDVIARADNGMTDGEIQEATGLKGDSERPRRQELQKHGLIEDSGDTRKGSTVWVLTAYGNRVFTLGESAA